MKKRKKKKWLTRTDFIGYMFVLPFLIGFVFFFLRPMLTSVVYSFSKVSFSAEGLTMEPVGWENYRYALFGDAEFFKQLLTIGGTVIVKIFVIMFMSIFVALLLNQKFSGRLFFRTVMFLPVIFGADVVISMFVESDAYTQMSGTSNQFVSLSNGTMEFLEELMASFGFLSGMMESFSEYASKIFDLSWEMGIQVVLFIIGLQSIPDYLYEVCALEGATKWEEFWKITFPLLSPSILLCLIYTIIDNFGSKNAITDMINENMRVQIHYACSQTWFYSILVLLMSLVVYRVVSKRVIYLD